MAATLIVRQFRFGLGWAGLGRAWLDQVCLWCWYERIPRVLKCAGSQNTGRTLARTMSQRFSLLLLLLLLLVIRRNEKPASIEI